MMMKGGGGKRRLLNDGTTLAGCSGTSGSTRVTKLPMTSDELDAVAVLDDVDCGGSSCAFPGAPDVPSLQPLVVPALTERTTVGLVGTGEEEKTVEKSEAVTGDGAEDKRGEDLVADDDEGEEDEEEQDEEEVVGEERPKLDDGFFEIEDIRKRRVVKGQLQYLIKWRGWPETANTWEPYENIKSCADIVQSFEERLRTHPRKRKRKSAGGSLQTIFKKKRPSSSTKIGKSPSKTSPSGKQHWSDGEKVEVKHVVDRREVEGGLNLMQHKDRTIDAGISACGVLPATAVNLHSKEIIVSTKEHVYNDTEVRGPGCIESTTKSNISVHLKTSEEDGHMDALSNAKFTQPVQGGGNIPGARRRKSSHVKRFDPLDAQRLTTVIKRIDEVEEKGASSTNPASVVKILMPVEFSTSMSNNLQDVSVTFKALSSDGGEVHVTNKFLKKANPQLLINFYEQHLRYGPP